MGALEADDLPPVLDLEVNAFTRILSRRMKDGRSRRQKRVERVDNATLRERALLWLQAVERHYGRRPIIYVSPGFWQEHMTSRDERAQFGGYPLWVAHYGRAQPRIPGAWTDWTLWQYSERGRIQGIGGSGVDLDEYNGTAVQLRAWVKQSASAPPRNQTAPPTPAGEIPPGVPGAPPPKSGTGGR